MKPAIPLPRRPYGTTGELLSIIGFSGIVCDRLEQPEANRIVAESVDAGVNYFDVAPSYGDAEQKLGPALEPYRRNVFLACKSTERTAAGIRKELEQSLVHLKTDHFDLYQLHALTTAEDIRVAFGPGGALEAIVKAREEGLVRYLGFSSHSVESAMAALRAFEFQSVLFPINFTMWHKTGFGPQVVEYARSKGAAVLALKSMAKARVQQGEKRSVPGCWYHPLADETEAALGLRFTLSQPVTAALPPGNPDLYRMALRLAPAFVPLSVRENDALKQQAMALAPIFEYPSPQFDVSKG